MILRKLVSMQNIYVGQSLNFLLKSVKMQEWFKCIYWVFKYNGQHLWEYWWWQPKQKKNFVFDDMIPDIMSNKKFQAVVKELFTGCRKLNIPLVFITQSYFFVSKGVRLNSTRYLIMKICNKKELQKIAINLSADIDYKDFMKIYRECTREPCSFLTIDTTLPASDPLRQ